MRKTQLTRSLDIHGKRIVNALAARASLLVLPTSVVCLVLRLSQFWSSATVNPPSTQAAAATPTPTAGTSWNYPAPPSLASLAPGDITTIAGGPGAVKAPATQLAILPQGVYVRNNVLYMADHERDVVRAIDLTTGEDTLLAGDGTGATTFGGYTGDGGPALVAQLWGPSGIAVDSQGNVYVAEEYNGVIRKIDAVLSCDGTHHITTYAGTGAGAPFGGYGGDGGPASAAQFSVPFSLAVDSKDNVYIADTGNYRIRKIDHSTGVITTYAGNGQAGYSGDGGPATSAVLNVPSGISIDSADNLYICDEYNNVVRKVDASTQIITTIAGNGTQGFSGDGGPAKSAQLAIPIGVGTDGAGNVYIADDNNQRIRKVDAGTQQITTVAGDGSPADPFAPTFSGDGGPALQAQLWYPEGLAVDPAGNIFIADTLNYRVRKVDATLSSDGTQHINTIAGNGTRAYSGDGLPALSAQLTYPTGVARDHNNNVYIIDAGNSLLRQISPSGIINTIVDLHDSNVLAIASVMDPVGNLYFTDTGANCIKKLDTAGNLTTYAGMCGGSSGDSGDGGLATSAALEGPRGLTFDSAGNLFISELSQYVRRVDAVTHIITTVAGNGQIGDAGDGGPATQAELYYPAGLAVDSAENLYIVEQGGDVVRKVDLNLSSPTYGIITLYAGTEGAVGFGGDGGPATMAIMQHPQGLAIDKNDNLFIADTENQRIRVVDKATQTISTAFGSSIIFSGDGGPAITAGIGNPGFGLAFDLDGNLLIDDEANNLVRVVKGPDVFKAQCSAVGKVVLADPTGDATDTLTSHDIQSIGVGEPYLDGCGSNALSFTMKVANLAFQSDEPGGRWTIYFTVSNGSEYFVDMEGNCTSSPIGVCFNYGHTATPAGGTKVRTIDGQADSRSNFTADGLITIVVPNADFTANSPAPATADTLTNINATVEVSTAGPLVDSTVSGTYTLSGSSSCKPNYRPMAGGLNVTPPSGTAPLAVNFTSTCSREPDACDVLASYTMDFGDGTAPTTQSSPNFSHTYTSAGNYIANLSVTDSAGTVSSNASRVAIQVTSGNPVQLTNVVSRKLHGGAGTFDIGLPLSGPLGIECRSGGSSSSYTLVFTFANPLSSVAAAGISSGAGSVASSNIAPDDAHNYIVNLTGVTNAQVITVTLSNVSDSAGNFSPAMAAQMGVLLGDVNASRRVDAADVSSVRQQTLQPLTSSNFRMDLNASGRIDAADVSIARQQTLTSLP